MKTNPKAISTEQTNYLHQVKRNTVLISLSRFLILISFLVLWESSSHFGWIDSFFFSSPSAIIGLFIKMCNDIYKKP